MVNYRLIFGLLLVALLAFSPAWAQQAGQPSGEMRGQGQEMQQRQTDQQFQNQQQSGQRQQSLEQAAPLKVSDDLIGKEVQNRQGEDLGDVHDVVLGPDGQISYIILSHGGILGVGGDLYPVPKDAITYNTQNDVVMLNMDKAKLEQAPKIQENDLAQLKNPEYTQQVHGYYGVEQHSGMKGDYKSMRDQHQGTQSNQQGTRQGNQGRQ